MDDVEAVRKYVAWLLGQVPGYVVMEAASGEEAVRIMQTFTPDLILLDMRMPGMGGGEVVEHCMAQGCRSPIVVLTAFPDDVPRKGVTSVLAKPFAGPALMELVKKSLRHLEMTTKPDHSRPGLVNGLVMLAVTMLAAMLLLQLFVLLPRHQAIATKQQELEAMFDKEAKHAALMQAAREREAVMQAKLLVHQEMALKLFKGKP